MIIAAIFGLVVVAGIVIYMIALPAIGDAPSDEDLNRFADSPQFRDGQFRNPIATGGLNSQMAATFWEMLVNNEGAQRTPPQPFEVVRPDPVDLVVPPSSGLRVTWLGHAAALIELDGKRVLVDPAFENRVSPLSWMGPARFHEVPIAAADMPRLDAVLISHNHYDHLDRDTILTLADRTSTIVVPLGVGSYLEGWGISAGMIREMDWWDSFSIGDDVAITATPAVHFSNRGFRDRDKSLWASYAIVGPKHRVYFGGDSGYWDGFDEIGRRLGPFDCTLMPIGAYHPAWQDIHMTPEEAVKVHQLIGGDLLLPIHWGTYRLALHDWTEPAERLLIAAEAAGVRVTIPLPGEFADPQMPLPTEAWWRLAREGQSTVIADTGLSGIVVRSD